LVGHDLSRRILYRFHRWLIFVRVIALFMFVWPYVRPHILCTQLVICLLSHFIHIWYLGWPWSVQTWKGLQLSQKSTICEIGIICAFSDQGQPRYQIWIKCDKRLIAYTRCADGRMVKQTWKGLQLSQKSTIREIGNIWACSDHIIPISQMVDFCESWSPFHVCLTIRPSAHLVYATSHLSFVGFYSYLVSWLAMIWACTYTNFTDSLFLREL
jgi:hypothetical protein